MLNELFVMLTKDANATNAVAAVASAVAATLALFVSALAVYVSHVTLKHQRRHNVLSVRPIPIVTVADYEDSVRVKIRNHGSGPMVVKQVQVGDGASTKESLVEWMPDLPVGTVWANFVGPVTDRGLLPGSEIVLLQLDGEEEDEVFAQARNSVRDTLARLTVVVDYTDIYESKFNRYTRDLTWFGRHRIGRYPE